LLRSDHPYRPTLTQDLQRCQRLLKLDARLPTILKGDAQPKDAAEQLELAGLCQHYRKRYAAAARFYAEAFTSGVAVTSKRAYNAACAAALAADGKGLDAAKFTDKEKAALRKQTLGWLSDALKLHRKHLEDEERRAQVRQTLQDWQQDPDLS